MNLFQAVILAVVEGFTEFLPISSTAHLVMVSGFMGVLQSEFVKSFEIIIQLGAILAVVVVYGQRVWGDKKLWGKIAAAFVPTGILGFILYKVVKKFLLGNSYLAIAALIIGGIVMLWWEKKGPVGKKEVSDLTYAQAAGIGVCQAIAVIPGVSRSAASVYGGMGIGLSRKAAVEMAFWLAVPTMAAATGLDVIKSSWGFTRGEWALLGVAFVIAFLVAWAAVKWLLKNLQSKSWVGMAVYRIFIALVWLLSLKISGR